MALEKDKDQVAERLETSIMHLQCCPEATSVESPALKLPQGLLNELEKHAEEDRAH